MPLVNIEWTPGRTDKQRDEVAQRVVQAMTEVTGLAPESIWVKFNEVSPEVWYVGADSIAKRARDRTNTGG